MDLTAQPGELFRLTVELSPSGMLAVDQDGTLLLVNREVERLFGYSREDLLGRPVEMLVPERFRPAHPGLRGEFHGDPHARPMGAGRELFGLRRDGSEFPVEIGLNPIHTEFGLMVFASIVDVTQRRQLEEQLRQLQKLEAVGTIAGGIAHDFNNLLLGIVGHAELARAEAPPGGPLRHDLDQIVKAAGRGRDLVQRILTFSRRHDVARAPLRVERAVADALELLRASIPATIEIRHELDPATPVVLSDETEIHQVVMNLATNAAHAMDGGGILEVRVGPFEADERFARSHAEIVVGRYARITVKDDGRGMAPEIARRAFEPFFTTKPPGTGTGLGLSVIRGIVRSHGGAIELTSRPGQGTRVDVYLPAAVVSELPADTGATPVGPARGRRIMLVDDEEMLAHMQQRRLEDLGYRVTTHVSSVDALEDFRAHPGDFDLLVTDNTMPRLTGTALAREVHRLRPDLPVLMVSGVLDTDDPATLRERGVTGVLQKPHTSAELEAAVRRALEG